MKRFDHVPHSNILMSAKREFSRSPMVDEKFRSVRIEKPRYKADGSLSKTPNVFYPCNHCGEHLKRPDLQCDHVEPVVPVQIPAKHMDWNIILEERLFVKTLDQLQILCKKCHAHKSLEENRERKDWRRKEKHIVYVTHNMINKKIYIGVHKCVDLNDGYLGSGTHLINAIKKYGRENFYRKVLYCFDNAQEAYDKEKELVDEEFINNETTYNLKTGGEGFPIGYTVSESTKKLHSEMRKGFDSPNRKKARKTWVDKKKENGKDYIKIKAINIKTQEIKEYSCIEDCAKDLKLSASCISRVAQGKQNRRQHKGWKFETEKYGKSLEQLDTTKKGIHKINKGGYAVKVNKKYLGYRKTLKEALQLKQSYLKENNE